MNRETVVKSLIYKSLERGGSQVVSFIVQICLARLLSPTDYGTLALIAVFVTISQVFVQSGLNIALIQRKDTDEVDYSSVFYVSLGISVVLYWALFGIAPVIASLYKLPGLTQVLRVLALILFPTVLNSVQTAKLTREMQFKKLMYSSLGAVVASGAAGIVMAGMGMGVWALVGQLLAYQIMGGAIMWFTVKWRPSRLFSWEKVRSLFSFSWKLLCSTLLDTVYQNLRSLVIVKRYGTDMLGYYNRGQQFPVIVSDNINGSIQTVMLPVLSREQENREQMKIAMRRAIVSSSYVVFPLMTGLAMIAKPLISLLLTDKWLPCVPYLQICCATYALYPIHTANLQAMSAQGRSDLLLKLEITKKAFDSAILLVTLFCFGSPIAIAMGGAASSVISTFINTAPNKKLFGYSFREQIGDILPFLLMSALMGACIYPIELLGLSNILTVFLQVAVGAVVYSGTSRLLKIEAYLYLANLLKSMFGRRLSLWRM